jgi:hypothetical protein
VGKVQCSCTTTVSGDAFITPHLSDDMNVWSSCLDHGSVLKNVILTENSLGP